MFYSSLVNEYYMMLGDLAGLNLNDENPYSELFTTFCFILATFLINVTILNMLIAIMADTFNQHAADQDVK